MSTGFDETASTNELLAAGSRSLCDLNRESTCIRSSVILLLIIHTFIALTDNGDVSFTTPFFTVLVYVAKEKANPPICWTDYETASSVGNTVCKQLGYAAALQINADRYIYAVQITRAHDNSAPIMYV